MYQMKGKVIKMKNYLMTDDVTGEDFIVEARNKKEAKATASLYFEAPRIYFEIGNFEAEMLGLDTY